MDLKSEEGVKSRKKGVMFVVQSRMRTARGGWNISE